MLNKVDVFEVLYEVSIRLRTLQREWLRFGEKIPNYLCGMIEFGDEFLKGGENVTREKFLYSC